jgi:hypothetical protein
MGDASDISWVDGLLYDEKPDKVSSAAMPLLASVFAPLRTVGGGDESSEGVGVSRISWTGASTRGAGCEEGGGVIEDGGGGELYLEGPVVEPAIVVAVLAGIAPWKLGEL